MLKFVIRFLRHPLSLRIMKFLERIESDYKVEAVAALMLEGDPDFGRILIERLGRLSRTHTRDIHRSYSVGGQAGAPHYTVFQTFRESLYEALPEGVFHPPTLGGLGRSPEEIVEEIRSQRKNEQAARAFFKPFEQEASYLEIQALLVELMFEKKHRYTWLYRFFERNWPIIRKLSPEAAMGFIYMLPLLSRARGKKDQAGAFLSYLTGYPVVIKDTALPIEVPGTSGDLVIGACRLGLSTTLPGTLYDGWPAWRVRVGPVRPEDASKMLPGSGFDELLDELLGFFVPSGIVVEKHLDIATANTRLGCTRRAGMRLGYTFTLG